MSVVYLCLWGKFDKPVQQRLDMRSWVTCKSLGLTQSTGGGKDDRHFCILLGEHINCLLVYLLLQGKLSKPAWYLLLDMRSWAMCPCLSLVQFAEGDKDEKCFCWSNFWFFFCGNIKWSVVYLCMWGEFDKTAQRHLDMRPLETRPFFGLVHFSGGDGDITNPKLGGIKLNE
jgi:hypothetical protein